jgi:hypothetical protein
MTERNLAIRLTVLDGGKVKAELREVGETGEKSLKKIELAGQPASKSLLALNAAANDVKGSVVGLTGNLGPLGSALGAIGPVGLAVGAALAVVTLGLKAAFEHAAEAEQSFNRLQAVLRATGNTRACPANRSRPLPTRLNPPPWPPPNRCRMRRALWPRSAPSRAKPSPAR